MKKVWLTVSCLGAALTASAALAETEFLPIDHIYTVKGFDSNDNAEVMIEGHLPDLCYKAPTSKARVIGKKIIINVTGYKDTTPGRICAQMTVPFLETVNVGVLDAGNYDVVVNGTSPAPKLTQLGVVESSSSAVDDHIYAAVEIVEKIEGENTVELKGYNPSDCLELDDIKYVSNEKDTYAVLPIMKKVRPNCPLKMVPFTYTMDLPGELERDKVLLHVRVMNGKSVNALIQK